MKVTKHKIVFGILGLAAAAFVIDRCTSSATPTPAHAMPPAPVAKVAAAAARIPAPTPVHAGESDLAVLASISGKLQQVSAERQIDATSAKDAFCPSSDWAPIVDVKSDSAERLAAANHFRQQHKLVAVMVTKIGGIALLDGKPLRPGQVVEGFRLAEIHEKCAIFEAGDSRVQLNVMAGEKSASTSENLLIQPAHGSQTW